MGILIKRVEIPANLNDMAYEKNLSRILNRFNGKYNELSLNGKDLYSYNYTSKLQRKFISYSIVQSIRFILMNLNKSIKNSNILLDIDNEKILLSILEELAKEARNVILLNNSINKIEKIRETIMSKYGLSIEVILQESVLTNIDFVVTSKNKEYSCNKIWHIKSFENINNNGIHVNNVLYKVPWNISLKEMPPQLIASIIRKHNNRSIPEILKSNDIMLESILYNAEEIILGKQ
ncbi:hypothetical protein [Clostridium taeniosporum]|uniref:hypothetical protein n=1 Tax=Clostridium taeniosporum TaxID=394958 RepID=UPI000A60E24E|nr:hypothetical protein [Clostridium taeniosporum]